MRGVERLKLNERRRGKTVMVGSISSIRQELFRPRLACFRPEVSLYTVIIMMRSTWLHY